MTTASTSVPGRKPRTGGGAGAATETRRTNAAMRPVHERSGDGTWVAPRLRSRHEDWSTQDGTG
jgi:hypothetical protein